MISIVCKPTNIIPRRVIMPCRITFLMDQIFILNFKIAYIGYREQLGLRLLIHNTKTSAFIYGLGQMNLVFGTNAIF